MPAPVSPVHTPVCCRPAPACEDTALLLGLNTSSWQQQQQASSATILVVVPLHAKYPQPFAAGFQGWRWTLTGQQLGLTGAVTSVKLATDACLLLCRRCVKAMVCCVRCQTIQLTPIWLCVGWHLVSHRCLQGMLPQGCPGRTCCWTAGSRAAQSACCSRPAATSRKPTVRSSTSRMACAAQALTASRATAHTDPKGAAVLGVVLVQTSGCCGWFQQGTLTTRCWCLGGLCCVLLCAAWQSAGVHCAAAAIVDGRDCVTATKQGVRRWLQQLQSLCSLTCCCYNLVTNQASFNCPSACHDQ